MIVALFLLALTSLVDASPAFAHGLGQGYDLPIPLWLFLYGAAAAAKHYFKVAPAKLSAAQAARLAAILPAPEVRDAAKPGPQTRRIARRIEARAAKSGPYVACVLD